MANVPPPIGEALDYELGVLREKVFTQLGAKSGAPVGVDDLNDAINAAFQPRSAMPQTSRDRVTSAVFSFTGICTMLCIVFGLLGFALRASNSTDSGGFLDLAKVFAGAIVGSKGASASIGRNKAKQS